MGNQNNHSVARKRLSTLAITTTLAAVGVGVVGAGAANAATNTPLAHTQNDAVAKTTAAVKLTDGGANLLNATADLTGTAVDPTLAAAATGTLDWGDGHTSPVTFDVKTGAAVAPAAHAYQAAGTYKVLLTVNDGTNPAVTANGSATVADIYLNAALSAKTATKTSPVTLALTGSAVDTKVAAGAKTTVDWGDKTTAATFTGDPSLIKASDPKLSHTFTTDGTYTVKVTLDDGQGQVTSTSTQSFTVTVSEKTGVQVLRAAGTDRYDTGLIISQHQWANQGVTTDAQGRQQAKAVVLSTGNAFPDALAGVPLAKKAQGPLLLTDGLQSTTNPAVLDEIKRILPTKGSTVYILGGDQAVSAGIESQLSGLGYTVQRLAGADRYATALQIAKVGMGDPSHVIVARGDEGANHDGFADALAAGPYAANVFGGGNSAIVLSSFNTFDPATQAYVTSKLHAGQQDVATVGGQATTAVGSITGSKGLYSSAVGADRYATAAKVAAAFLPAGKADQVGVATGLKFPDALTGGAYMASVDGPLLLTAPSVLPVYTANAITGTTTQQVNIFGGDQAISNTVANEIAALVKVATLGKF